MSDPLLDPEQRRDKVMDVVQRTFKPEFLNRLDDVVVFDALSTEDLARIVDLQVALLAGRLRERRLTLDVTAAAREWLTLTGYDPAYGARPLRRLVQKAIGDTLARSLLAGEVQGRRRGRGRRPARTGGAAWSRRRRRVSPRSSSCCSQWPRNAGRPGPSEEGPGRPGGAVGARPGSGSVGGGEENTCWERRERPATAW